MKKKSFREQMTPIIETRHRNDTDDCKKEKLDKATTVAAETLITYIRQWPEQHSTRNQALGRLIECQRWTKDGGFYLERNYKGRAYPCRLPLEMAYEWYRHGDQRKRFYPAYNFASAVKQIPTNVQECWLDEIKGLFYDINHIPLESLKLVALGKWVQMYGTNNPHTFAGWDRSVSEFGDAQKAIDVYVSGRDGWEYMTTENLQNPKHSKDMSKILNDILVNADATVEPALKSIREQDRRMYIGQDATQARNNVKSLKKFLAKYEADLGCLTSVSETIDATEQLNLKKTVDTTKSPDTVQ